MPNLPKNDYFKHPFWDSPFCLITDELEYRSRLDNLRSDRIAEYKNESLAETEDIILNGKLSETLSIRNIPINSTLRLGDKNQSVCRTMVAKFSHFKVKERIVEEAKKKKIFGSTKTFRKKLLKFAKKNIQRKYSKIQRS